MTHRLNLLLAVALLVCCSSVAAKSRDRQVQDDDDDEADIPQAHFLVEMIGKEIYHYVKRPTVSRPKIPITLTILQRLTLFPS